MGGGASSFCFCLLTSSCPGAQAMSSISCVHILSCLDSDNTEGPCPSSSNFLNFEAYSHEIYSSVKIKKKKYKNQPDLWSSVWGEGDIRSLEVLFWREGVRRKKKQIFSECNLHVDTVYSFNLYSYLVIITFIQGLSGLMFSWSSQAEEVLKVRGSVPRQVDKKSEGPWGERGLGFSRKRKGSGILEE